MGKVTDKSCSEYYVSMIEKRDSLKSTSELLSKIISNGYVSDANLRMLLNQVKVFNDEDGGIDVVLEFNGNFNHC